MSHKVTPITGIEMPAKSNGVERKYPFDTMDVGAMFFLEGRTASSLVNYASRQGRALGKKFSVRNTTMRWDSKRKGWRSCEADHPDAVEGVGCWRLT